MQLLYTMLRWTYTVIFSFQFSGFLTVAEVHPFKLLHFHCHYHVLPAMFSTERGEGWSEGGRGGLYPLLLEFYSS